MSFRPRMKLVAACVGAAIAQLGAGQASADSAVGVDTALGNALNPPGRSAIPRPLAGDGYDTVRRSPSGQLYGEPLQPAETSKTEGGWEYSAGVEVGAIGGGANTKNTKFREYKDLKNGGYLNYFEAEGDKAETAHFFQTFGGGAGQHDQFYGFQFGRYNDWKIKGFYNETPHVFSSDFKPIYQNNGSGRLTYNLGNAAQASLGATYTAGQALADTEVGLVRKKGGLRVDLNLTDEWKLYASATHEKREGERPYTFMAAEGVEPIDYKTTDLLAGLQYADSLTSVNLRASASLFRNAIHTLYARVPTLAANPAPVTLATMDSYVYSLPPDNEAYNVKGEFSRKLPDFYKGVFSAALAWGSSRQDDAIRMPLDPGMTAAMTTGGVVPAANAGNVVFDVNNWNGVNGSPLTRSTSGQRIDSKLLNLSLSLHPTDDLAVKGAVRHYATDNKSGTYYSYNPLTGQWFTGLFNSSSAFGMNAVPNASGNLSCQPAPGFPVAAGCGFVSAATGNAAVAGIMNSPSFASLPRDNKQTNYTLSADYDLGNARSIEGSLERENYSHTYRERDKTWENKIKLGYVDRSLGDATLRASYEEDKKRGSYYDPLVTTRMGSDWFQLYGQTYSRAGLQNLISIALANPAGTGIYPPLANIRNWIVGGNGSGGNGNYGGMMKPDQADRDQNIFNARLNYMARDDLDIGGMIQLKRTKYPANSNGLQRDDLNSYNFDLNYQPLSSTQFTFYYSRQEGEQRQVENYSIDPATGAAYTAANLQAYVAGICGALTVNNIDCWLNSQRNPGANVTVDTKNKNDVFGFGVSQDYGAIKIAVNYSYAKGISSIVNSYGPNALTAVNQTSFNTYGNYPDIKTVENVLDLNVLVPIEKNLTARLMYRYENFKINDWHYDYLSLPITTFAAADMGPRSYHVNVVGAFLQYKF